MTENIIYEHSNGAIYSRKFGETQRTFVRYTDVPLNVKEEIKLWLEIVEEAKNNTALQAELDRVKMLYYLTKKIKQL